MRRHEMFNINFRDDDYTDDSANNIREWVQIVGKEFENSRHFQNLSLSEQESYPFLLEIFFEYSYSYCLVGPGKIDNDVIDEMMLDVMPRKISAAKETFEAFTPMMEQFLLWCEEKNYMGNTKSIREYIQKRSQEMIARSQDPNYWGMAKSMLMGGPVNFNIGNDYKALTDTAEASNGVTIKRNIPKIGRNDPCSCGSGKKYKKCCLEK